MTRRTKKVGIVGRYGSRYGVKVRRRIKEVEDEKKGWHICPSCNHPFVRRISTGVWKCRRCQTIFAGGAYKPIVTTVVKREVSLEGEGLEKPEGKEVGEK